MKNQMILATGTFLCMTGIVLGQEYRPVGPVPIGATMRSGPIPLTFAMKARLEQIRNLDGAAKAAMDAGHYVEAESDARQSVSLGMASGRGQGILAAALYAQGKDHDALLQYRVLAGIGSENPREMLPYALLLLNTGQWEQAVSAYDRALPTISDGAVMRENNNFSPAVAQFRELAAAIHIGMGLMESGGRTTTSHDRSLNEFQKATALDPNSPLAAYYYGYGLRRLGHHKEAQVAFQKAAGLDSGGDVKAAAEKALSER